MYDAFISYSSKDKRFAKHLAKSLMEKGVNVWFDRWEMKPGESLIEKISEAIHKSSYLFALLSPESVSSNWVKQELRQAMTEEIYSEKVKVVPIIIEGCEIPLFLKDKHYVDFTDDNPYDYNIQKLVDLVFESPRAPDRPPFSKQLFDRYNELLSSKDPDRAEFLEVAHRALTVVERHLIPSHEEAYPEGSYFKSKKVQAEVNLVLNRLKESAEAYECAYNYALEKQNSDLVFEAAIPRFCVLCFMNKTDEADAFLEEFYSNLSNLLPSDSSLNFQAILDYVVEVCFYENVGVENPLTIVFDNDHHLLNLRIERALDMLFKSIGNQNVEGHSLYYVFGNMLEHYGLIRLALKYFKQALASGDSDADEKIRELKSSQEGAIKMAPYFGHGVRSESAVGAMLAINLEEPRSLTRTLMCSGVYVDTSEMVKDIKERIQEREASPSELQLATNGVSPVKMLIFEDSPGSAKGIADQLTAGKVGAVTVRSNDQAEAALRRFKKIKLYVSDHHFRRGGMISISCLLCERDVLKKRFLGIKSTILTNNPNAKSPKEDPCYGFKSAGGDFITDCRGKTDKEIASELVELLEMIS